MFAAWQHHEQSAVDGYDPERPVSFELRGGEWLGIVGRNGVGKSTLLHAIAGTAPYVAGEVVVDGVILPTREPEARFTANVSHAPQHAEFGHSQNDLIPIADALDITFAERPGLFNEKAIEALQRQLANCGWLEGLPEGMLGGRLFDLFCAILVVPRVLLLDEVIAACQPRKRTAERYRELRALLPRSAVVFTDHDVDRMVEVADKLLWLRSDERPVTVQVAKGDETEQKDVLLDQLVREYAHEESAETSEEKVAVPSGALLRDDRIVGLEFQHAVRAAAIESHSLSRGLVALSDERQFLRSSGLVRHLSGGQRVFVASMLARAVGRIIDRDETMHLDSNNRSAVELVEKLGEKKNAVSSGS